MHSVHLPVTVHVYSNQIPRLFKPFGFQLAEKIHFQHQSDKKTGHGNQNWYECLKLNEVSILQHLKDLSATICKRKPLEIQLIFIHVSITKTLIYSTNYSYVLCMTSTSTNHTYSRLNWNSIYRGSATFLSYTAMISKFGLGHQKGQQADLVY